MTFVKFGKITNELELMAFFMENFFDIIPLIGRDRLITDFFKLKPQYFVQIKVS